MAGFLCVGTLNSRATDVRIVTYNINADSTDFNTTGIPPVADVQNVFGGIAAEHLAGNAQLPDVILLQELNATPSVTLSAMCNDLNSMPGVAAGTYVYDTNVYTQAGYYPTDTGNGPSGLVYNSKTIQEVGSPHYIGTTSSSGAAREPVRYLLQPVGFSSAAQFYVYTDHYKADSGYQTRRNVEAQSVRADADALPANSHIIYTGDFNLTGGGSEPAYQTLIASGGTGQAFDPLTTTFSANSTSVSNVKLYTESATSLTARFDFQMVSSAALPSNNQPGIQLVSNSYMAFGNSYYSSGVLSTTMTEGGAVNSSSNTGPLTDLSNRSAVLNSLTTLTDHLPVVADYAIVVPEPTSLAAPLILASMTIGRRRRKMSK